MKFTIQVWEQNEILRKKSSQVMKWEWKQYTALADKMIQYVRDEDNRCVGLAAPQIGVNKRIIAVSLMRDYDDENFRTVAMINPEILEFSTDCDTDSEGCLSVPGESGDVTRPTAIKLRYFDVSGREQTFVFRGLPARIIQHEIDHLDGVLFTDRVVQNESAWAMRSQHENL